MKRILIVFLLAALQTACTAQPETDAVRERNAQWIYRTDNGREPRHFAVFLSWDYSAVIFRAQCEPGNQLLIEYYATSDDYAEGALPIAGRQIVVYADGDDHEMTTTHKEIPLSLEGRLAVSPAFAKSITSARNIDIGTNNLGEPFYTGYALPLRRIIDACQ